MAKKKEMACCSTGGYCFCKAIMAIAIIILIWVSQATWSKIVITILAALIILGAGGCACRGSWSKK